MVQAVGHSDFSECVAGVLGGVTRMTMSLAVIVLELTNDIDLLLPIMLAIGIAKQVADCFNRGLYDIHIGLNKIPMLEAGLNFADQDLPARSIMSMSVVSVGELVPHKRLREIIATNAHHGFPVTSSDAPSGSPDMSRVFAGIISRQRIVELLASTSDSSSEVDANCLIDLRPHCDRSPYTVCETLPLRRVFRLFTTMGLRHLVVVDRQSLVVGMITRKDLLKEQDTFNGEKLQGKDGNSGPQVVSLTNEVVSLPNGP
jgi:chloride channel 7